MGDCEVVRSVDLPLGESPDVGEDEFCWELPARRGHWIVLKKPSREAVESLRDYTTDIGNPEPLRDVAEEFFRMATGIGRQS